MIIKNKINKLEKKWKIIVLNHSLIKKFKKKITINFGSNFFESSNFNL